MALLFCDGFDFYSTNEFNLLNNLWDTMDFGTTQQDLSQSNPRHGTGHIRANTFLGRDSLAKIISPAIATIGAGVALYTTFLPKRNNLATILSFRDPDDKPNISLVLQSTGTISVVRGDAETGTILGTTATACIRAKCYQHIECKANFDSTTGFVEVRVNGVTVLSLINQDTVAGAAELKNFAASAANSCGWVALEGFSEYTFELSENYIVDFDDFFIWDTTGTYNNDFLGDQFVSVLAPNADTAAADWTALSGSGFENIDNADPDSDSTYIYAGAPGSPAELTSEFDMSNLATSSGPVAAVMVLNRVRKDDTSVSPQFQAGIVQGGSTSKTLTEAVTPMETNFWHIFETDPSSGIPFTASDVNSLKLQLNRTN